MDPSSEHHEQEQSSGSQPVERSEPAVYEWVGEIVIVNYSRGPSWAEANDPYDIARGPIEGREGVFFLQEVSRLGVLLRRPIRDEGFAEPFFMPWGSVHMIELVPPEEETEVERAEHAE